MLLEGLEMAEEFKDRVFLFREVPNLDTPVLFIFASMLN